MATIRHSIRCLTCASTYTMRIGVGHRSIQTFTFPCDSCKLPITVCLHVNQKDVLAWITPEENCKNSETEGIIYNFNPDFLIPAQFVNSDKYFPLDQVRNVVKKWEKFIAIRCNDNIGDLYRGISYGIDIVAEHSIRRKAVALSDSGRKDLASKELEQSKPIFNQTWNADHFTNHLMDLHIALVHPGRHKQLQELKRFVNSVRGKPGFKYAQEYLKQNEIEHRKKYLEADRYFFECYNELGKVLMYVRCDLPLPNAPTCAGSKFDEIKKLYGDGFEIAMDLAVVPAILNNLYYDRPFDQFQNMSLRKYLTTDKSGRMDCFASNTRVSFLRESVNSQIRNGSHHGNIELNQSRNEVIYLSGRPPTLKSISYGKYLELSAKLFLDIFCIFAMQSHAMMI